MDSKTRDAHEKAMKLHNDSLAKTKAYEDAMNKRLEDFEKYKYVKEAIINKRGKKIKKKLMFIFVKPCKGKICKPGPGLRLVPEEGKEYEVTRQLWKLVRYGEIEAHERPDIKKIKEEKPKEEIKKPPKNAV